MHEERIALFLFPLTSYIKVILHQEEALQFEVPLQVSNILHYSYFLSSSFFYPNPNFVGKIVQCMKQFLVPHDEGIT